MQELKANPHRNAKGTVIEAGLDISKGPVATFIVQKGTLKKGDIIVSGEAFGKATEYMQETKTCLFSDILPFLTYCEKVFVWLSHFTHTLKSFVNLYVFRCVLCLMLMDR